MSETQKVTAGEFRVASEDVFLGVDLSGEVEFAREGKKEDRGDR